MPKGHKRKGIPRIMTSNTRGIKMKKFLLIVLAFSLIISCGPVIKPTKSPSPEIKLDVPFVRTMEIHVSLPLLQW